MSVERTDDTRERIKDAARRLFGERGIEKVSVREILAAAGQRNLGAIGYYFSSKSALVQEILMDGARLLDSRRRVALDALEARDEPITLRDVVAVIIRTCLDVKGDPMGETYVRFFSLFQRHEESLFHEVVKSHYDVSFRRCVAHMRRLSPQLRRQVLNERIIFMQVMIGSILALRESALEQYRRGRELQVYGGRMWESEVVIDNLIDACVGLFARPSSVRMDAMGAQVGALPLVNFDAFIGSAKESVALGLAEGKTSTRSQASLNS